MGGATGDGSQQRLGVFYSPGGFSPFELAEAASGHCRLVWLVNWSDEPLDVPARFLARLGDVVDLGGLDLQGMVAAVAAGGVDGITVFTDTPQPLAAAIAGALGLPGHAPQTAAALADKWVQRRALAAGGLPVPRFTTLRPADAGRTGWVPDGDVTFPAVLKPRRGAGSRDAHLVADRAELGRTLRACGDEPFILEEYLEGRPGLEPRAAAMVSVESVVVDGGVHHLAVTGRFPLQPPFRETGSFLPSDIPDQQAVRDTASAAAVALGVRRGVLHTEVKLTPDGPRVIEVNGRVGGGIPALLRRVHGPGILPLAMRLALGSDPPPEALEPVAPRPVAFVSWVQPPLGAVRIAELGGLPEVGRLPGVDEVRPNHKQGESLDPNQGGPLGCVVTVEGLVADHDALWTLQRRVSGTLRMRFEER